MAVQCHYALLEVDRQADDDTIKKAYRKLALKWHPDKNPDRVEECTQYFALVQQAYEVLSDPHERAFYDRHRERFGNGAEEKSLDLFKYFNSSCYSGFEGPKSFFKIYRDVFTKLAEEDYAYIDDEYQDYPCFGDKDSDYDKVVGPFYGFWSSFNTARSFAWLDKFDIREANNRYEARFIEAENKKFRESGKAERNDQIRELVAFIRKRDPRIKSYRELLEKRQLEAKQKQEENRRKQLQKNQEQYGDVEAIHEQNRAHFENLLAEHDEESMDEEEESENVIPHCVACNKTFKSDGALESHKNSKQHKKQMAELLKHMKEEDAAIFEEASTPEKLKNPGAKLGKKAKRRAKKKKGWDDESESENQEDDAEKSEKEEEINIEVPQVLVEEVEENKEIHQPKERKPRRAKKDKKAVVEVESELEEPVEEERPKKKEKKQTEKPEPEEVAAPKMGSCEKCGEFFESRTKLFDHIRKTGHATLKTTADEKKNKKTKKN